MQPADKQAFIRWKVHQNRLDPEGEKILWSRHGIRELLTKAGLAPSWKKHCKTAR
jgi:hypothetical protein